MIRVFILVLCFTLCSGCASYTTKDELKQKPTLQSQFEVAGSIQQIVKRITIKYNECKISYTAPTYTLTELITVLDEVGEAQIEYKNTAKTDTFLLVDISTKDNKAHVAIYSDWKINDWDRVFKSLEYGAKGLPGCP